MSNPPDDARRERALRTKRKVVDLFPDVPFLTHDGFRQKSESDASNPLIVDCRESAEREVSTIPGAISMSEAETRLASTDTPQVNEAPLQIICYCTIGLRSGLYARTLKAPGRDVSNYSIIQHVWGGGNLSKSDDDEGPVEEVHIFHSSYKGEIPTQYRHESFGHLTALRLVVPLGPSIVKAFFSKKRTIDT